MAPRRTSHRGVKRSLGVLASSSLLAAAVVGVVPGTAGASSHREAPAIVNDPQHDNTDTYAFVSPDKPDTTTIIANWIPLEEPNGGPNFYPWAAGSKYYINIDNDGDGLADLKFAYVFRNVDSRGDRTITGNRDEGTFLYNTGPVTSFADRDLRFKQLYTLTEEVTGTVLIRSGRSAPSNVGPASMPDYPSLRQEAVSDFFMENTIGTSFAGQADDSFFLDLRVFDLLYGGDLSEVGQDTLAGYNVNSVALQVPSRLLALNGNVNRNPVIGVWSTTERQTLDLETGQAVGDFVQVSRLGNPLVNEVVVPANLKDAFNSIVPAQDATAADGQVLQRVLEPELPRLIEAIYGIPAPATPRTDLAEVFLTGVTTALDGTGLWTALGAPTDEAPIALDLNSQAMNADVDPAAFVPSEMLRLNMSIPPTENPDRLGVLAGDLQGFPNGRRLIDDVVDIEIQVVEGFFVDGDGDGEPDGLVEALAAGDAVNENDVPFSNSFPYIALPQNEGVNVTFGGDEYGGDE
ncbi:MAG: DUF4331 domain-containing protein [Geodermatophilaceae bacterium]|nr:DUF4331 domain-containing protein [Geodermatophilaceae bacterium]